MPDHYAIEYYIHLSQHVLAHILCTASLKSAKTNTLDIQHKLKIWISFLYLSSGFLKSVGNVVIGSVIG